MKRKRTANDEDSLRSKAPRIIIVDDEEPQQFPFNFKLLSEDDVK